MPIAAKRYAEGLIDTAKELNSVTKYKEQLELLVNELLTEDLRNILTYPGISLWHKKELLMAEMKDKIDEHIINFLLVLLDSDRLKCLNDIVNEYKRLANKLENIYVVEITSAFELEDDLLDKIKNKIKKMYGSKDVEIKVIIDPSVIGGIKIKVGDTIIDGTIKTKLQNIEKAISEVELY